jgi:dTDP-4-dehydrorhamnose 3,5-epimerase
MKISKTSLPGLLTIDPAVHGDDRGFFLESWNGRKLLDAGIEAEFTQDNHSRSVRGVLRGLHYQAGEHAQGKLVRVTLGEVFDVVVDLRRSSPTFGRWHGERLSAENFRQLWVPPGFAHGFLVLSEVAEFQYKCTGRWNRDAERALVWNDPSVGVRWPLDDGCEPILSDKDRNHAASLSSCETFP